MVSVDNFNAFVIRITIILGFIFSFLLSSLVIKW